jgi:hypothetical protein
MTNTEPIMNVTTLPLESSISYVRVTPETAERWLNSNQNNRRIHEAKIKQYAEDMRQGRWTHGADMICFGTDGTLLNGQHRLQAVVHSGCTVTFVVQRNTPSDAMPNIDSGIPRWSRDILRWNGEENVSTLSSATKLAMIYTDGRIYKSGSTWGTSNGAIIAFIEANPELRRSVAVGQNVRRYVDCSAAVLAAAHWIIASVNNTETADHFFHQLAHKGGEAEGSAVLILDRRLRKVKAMQGRYSHREYLALLIKGWNYYATQTSAVKLNIVQRGQFSIPDVVRLKALD